MSGLLYGDVRQQQMKERQRSERKRGRREQRQRLRQWRVRNGHDGGISSTRFCLISFKRSRLFMLKNRARGWTTGQFSFS